MEYRPFFIARSLFSPAKARPMEKIPGREEGNVSLELSLSSLNYSSTVTSTDKGKEIYSKQNSEVVESNYSNDHYQRKECNMKNSGRFSSEPSDVSLELSLSIDDWTSKRKSSVTGKQNQKNFEVGECSTRCHQREEHNVNNFSKVGGLSLQPNLAVDDSRTSKKRERMENPSSSRKDSSCRNKRDKVEREERSREVVSNLRLAHDPWCIKKKLFDSDIGNLSRLMLATKPVESHVFRFWNDEQLAKINEGLPVSVWDCDTNTVHELVFKKWSNGAHVLINNWTKYFVKRRELKQGDEIGLYWDTSSSRFKFSVLNRAARQ